LKMHGQRRCIHSAYSGSSIMCNLVKDRREILIMGRRMALA